MRPIDFHIKQGDTRPYIRGSVTNQLGELIDLSIAGTEIEFHLADSDGNPVALTGLAGDVNPPEDGENIQYAWAAGDTDGLAGVYDAEFEITYPDGGIETFPNARNLRIAVTRDLEASP